MGHFCCRNLVSAFRMGDFKDPMWDKHQWTKHHCQQVLIQLHDTSCQVHISHTPPLSTLSWPVQILARWLKEQAWSSLLWFQANHWLLQFNLSPFCWLFKLYISILSLTASMTCFVLPSPPSPIGSKLFYLWSKLLHKIELNKIEDRIPVIPFTFCMTLSYLMSLSLHVLNSKWGIIASTSWYREKHLYKHKA